MFLTADHVASMIAPLSGVHPFHGITYLACKQGQLPVGQTTEFRLDAKTNDFLKHHHKLDPNSSWFYQPFKSIKKWVRYDYASSGLQAINTQTFGPAFLHDPGTRRWGWSQAYLQQLLDKLPRHEKVPAYSIAVWLYRDFDFPPGTKPADVIERFFLDFFITPEERQALFDEKCPANGKDVFQQERPTAQDLLKHLTSPPDAKPEEGGTLAYLEIHGLGPAEEFIFPPAKRLNLITGDNGLGKSFLLDAAWWALTGIWAEHPLYPNSQVSTPASITFAIEGRASKSQNRTIQFDWKSLSWPNPKNRPTIPGLIVYGRVDGSFAVWDPARQHRPDPNQRAKVVLSGQDVWDGLPGRIEGLVRDWVKWQTSPDTRHFETFKRVLAKLSPPDLGQLTPGKTVRVPDDPRDIPTLVHPYGEVPILNASAGVRRIVTLAYLIVWAWHEHLVASEMIRAEPQRRMVVLLDEIEAHLHPKWQRSLLPALMEINALLAPELEAQYLVATHSPLVMASSEAIFSGDTDKLFHLDFEPGVGKVTLQEVDFVKFGDVSSWLTSPIFELRHARSNEADTAIEAAKVLQLKSSPEKEEIERVTSQLKSFLAPDDRFWPRWISFAEKFGIDL